MKNSAFTVGLFLWLTHISTRLYTTTMYPKDWATKSHVIAKSFGYSSLKESLAIYINYLTDL